MTARHQIPRLAGASESEFKCKRVAGAHLPRARCATEARVGKKQKGATGRTHGLPSQGLLQPLKKSRRTATVGTWTPRSDVADEKNRLASRCMTPIGVMVPAKDPPLGPYSNPPSKAK